MVVFAEFSLRPDCTIKTGESGGVPIYTEYEEDGRHKPFNLSTTDPEFVFKSTTQLLSFKSCTPRKGYELSEIELPIDWETFTGLYGVDGLPKFVIAQFDYPTSLSDAPSHNIYGWVDSAEPVATKGPSTNTRIRWHVDYWMTAVSIINWKKNDPTAYANINIAFGEGRITRGPSSLARPTPSRPRKWEYKTRFAVDSSGSYQGQGPYQSGKMWFILMVSSNDQELTDFTYYVWQDGMTSPGLVLSPYVEEIFDGRLAGILNIDPDKIIGCWMSPIQPFSLTGLSMTVFGSVPNQRAVYVLNQGVPIVYSQTYYTKKMTDDTNKWVLMDIYGSVKLTAPWGLAFDTLKLAVDIGTLGGNLIVHLYDSEHPNDMNEGRVFSVPLNEVPILSNAKASYVYSGQREYDIETRKLQNEQQLLSGIAGAGQSAISGGIAGGVSGAGGAAGAVAGLGISIAGAAGNYAISSYYGGREQAAVDKLMSNQAASPIVTGHSIVWKYFDAFLAGATKIWWLVNMKWDSVSEGEFLTEQAELGYITDSYTTDCQSLIQAGGPLKIEGLRIKGDVSPECKRYIAALFERGVNIDLIL